MLVLYNPVSSAGRKPILPMSLLALGAVLEGKHDYHIIDGNLHDDRLGTLTAAILETDTLVLGVTVMPGPQLHDAAPLCEALKQRFPQLTIVWGGYFPTQHYAACLRAEYVDYVVRGHAELAFLQLLDCLRDGGDPLTIAGVIGKNSFAAPADPLTLSERFVASMPAIPHPEQLPDFPYQHLPMERYLRRTFLGSRTLPHHSSYGCPFFCNFCAVVNMVNGRWLAQSAERTASTVRHLVETYGANAIEFYDNNFFVHEARTREFAARISDLSISWWGEARIDTLLKYPDTTWQTMRASGLKMIFLGAESGSDETLQRMNKGGTATTEKTLALAAKMRDYAIVPEMSFVLGNPPDPEADVDTTLRFIRKLKRVNPATEIILYLYTPVPLAGELFEQAQAQGFRFPETIEGWLSPEWQEFSQRRSATMPWLHDPLRRRIRNFERVLNAYYPTTTDMRLRGPRRALLRGMAAWRYQLGIYHFPVELRAMQRLFAYQRPETASF
jgi:hypothetical protein